MIYSPVSRKAIGLLILVFALGIAVGVAGARFINGHVYGAPPTPPEQSPSLPVRAVARLTNELNLSADQQKQLDTIFEGMQNGYDTVREQMNPQIEQVRQQGRNKIRQVLTADQLPKFEDYLRRLDEERRKRNNR